MDVNWTVHPDHHTGDSQPHVPGFRIWVACIHAGSNASVEASGKFSIAMRMEQHCMT
jgi:hypothetical protein